MVKPLGSGQILLVRLFEFEGEVQEVPVSVFGAPESIDVKGNPVETTSEIIDGNLVHTIDARDAALPVIFL